MDDCMEVPEKVFLPVSLSLSFFLEKNMQTYFLKILTQKCGRYVCVQLLQTLNILFENIRNETSICKSPACTFVNFT